MTTVKAHPDRIRVEQDAEGFWTCREAVSGSQEYVRADLMDDAVHALNLALEYWADRQQRYKNRHPVWVQEARKVVAKNGASS